MNKNQICNIIQRVLAQQRIRIIRSGKDLEEGEIEDIVEAEMGKLPKRGNSLAIRFKTPYAVNDAVEEEFADGDEGDPEDVEINEHQKFRIKEQLNKLIQYGECLTVHFDYENNKLYIKE